MNNVINKGFKVPTLEEIRRLGLFKFCTEVKLEGYFVGRCTLTYLGKIRGVSINCSTEKLAFVMGQLL